MGFYMLDNPNPNATQGVFPRRGGVKLSGTAIMHTTESVLDQIGPDATAEDCAAFIRTRSDFGCYHDLVDSDSIIEMYPFEWETWQDSETNNWAVGIAAACRTTDWATMSADRREGFYRNLAWCAADFVKYMQTKGITVPLKRITGEQARNRVPGFCAHGDSGIHRSDPGKDFDWTKFFAYTKQILDGSTKAPTGGNTLSWDTKIQEYQTDGKTKKLGKPWKTAAFILGNIDQYVTRILKGQEEIKKSLAEVSAKLDSKE